MINRLFEKIDLIKNGIFFQTCIFVGRIFNFNRNENETIVYYGNSCRRIDGRYIGYGAGSGKGRCVQDRMCEIEGLLSSR